ncbi:MAG: hypothetical protein NWQ64_00235 [Paracoccaceae bacterium]|jgi:hypothetical protein|nr:hypothetical protein [Pseudomonadota bacterium]MDO7567813.1 hypothetical protein [Paracoccaceae bacterium]MDO7733579.1 hypothetical protein [Paracoccaceae bacterium]MDP5333077.1 hypothetical protein [Paracoccaceae bacterium]MDP5356549.1 hypothetical protein [Paracoccaceae bacterium]
MTLVQADPKGLVRESYNIEGITAAQCRSIFLDWALSLANGQDVRPALATLIAHYPPLHAYHPMNRVLDEAQSPVAAPVRRGGRKSRVEGA